MRRFTELLVWQRSHALTLDVYRLTARFPADERFGVTSQLRRAILSVPANIAEGAKRISSTEFARFLNIAEGSLAEAEYLLIVSRDLGYVPQRVCEVHLKEVTEIAKMLNGLRSKVEKT